MTETPFAQPAPMPFRFLIDEAVRYARRNFRSIYPAVAIPVAILASLVAVFQALWYSRLVGAGDSPDPMDLAGGCATILVALILGIVMGFGYAALHVAAIDVVSGRPVDMRRAWAFPFRPAVLGTSILSSLAVMAAFMLCILPGFYVLPLLAFVLPVMVTEARFGPDALSRSAELTKWSPTGRITDSALAKALLLLILLIALSYVLAAVIAIPFQLPMYIDMFRSAAAGEEPSLEKMGQWMWLQVPAQFLSALVTTALYLYMSFCTALLFADTRGRKEGTDLRTAFDQVFAPPPPPGPARSAAGSAVLIAEGISPADRALVERVLAESGVQQTPVPPESSYFQELWLAFQQGIVDLLKRSTLLALPAAALIGIAVVVAALAVLLIARALLPRYRARRAKAREEAGAVVAVGAPPALRDAASWRAELERRLAEGRAAEALEAAWWWLARSVAGDRVEPDWTSRDLLAQARREDLTDVVRRLDVLTYGPDRPGLQEVRTLVGRLEAVLA